MTIAADMTSMKIDSTITMVSSLFQGIETKWAITGSCSLYIHGYKIFPNDIDIIADVETCDALYETNRNIFSVEFKYSESFNIKSYFSEIKIFEFPIQIMADVMNKNQEGIWVKNTDWRNSILVRDICGSLINYTSLDHEIAILRLKGNNSRLGFLQNGAQI